MQPKSAFQGTLAAPRPRLDRWLRSPAIQGAGVLVTVAFVVALHAHNDGLWFQGDAPRHAANGLFWWDFLRALPSDPLMFAVRYYARYPVISPMTYPPLFYVLEGLAFQIFGASPYTAKLLVAAFATIAGLYTTAWGRRWIGPLAGWAGAFLTFVPAMVLWTNAVMLNIPATALGLACLYHFRRWLDTALRTQLILAVVFLSALLLTYFQGVSVVPVWIVWAVLVHRDSRFRRPRVAWLAGATVIAVVPLALAAYLAPVQMARHLPVLGSVLTLRTWTYYWKLLPQVVGSVVLLLAAAGLAAALRVARLRTESAFIISWIAMLIVSVSLVPARDARYILLVAPAFVLAIAVGLAAIVGDRPAIRPAWQAVMLASGLTLGFWSATRVAVPEVSGFREVAAYLRQHAPSDAVLYDGRHDGVFGFSLRAMDPDFEQRIVRGGKLLYEYGPTTTFRPVEISKATDPAGVVNIIQSQCGCRWVAVEMGPDAERLSAQRLLRRTLARPEFELVRAFPVKAAGTERVDLYRVLLAITPINTVDLTFPAFSNRIFSQVTPITR